jgi:hypothetical protein
MERRLIRQRSNQHRLGPACLCVQARERPEQRLAQDPADSDLVARGHSRLVHGMNVEASQLDDQRLLAHALAILLTVGGTPSIYAGDEGSTC